MAPWSSSDHRNFGSVASLYPDGSFVAERFRRTWWWCRRPAKPALSKTVHRANVAIGEQVLADHREHRRCVMTTLAQGDLPKDLGILRTAVEANQANRRASMRPVTPAALSAERCGGIE